MKATMAVLAAVLALAAAGAGFLAWQKNTELEAARRELAASLASLEKARAEMLAAKADTAAARKELAEQAATVDKLRSEVASAATFIESERAISARLRQDLSL